MKKPIIIIATTSLLLSAYLVLSINSSRPKCLIIKNTTVISPERNRSLERGYIRIRGDSVEAVGEWSEDVSSSGCEVHDADGRYVIPGLIDAHVHLSVIPGVADDILEEVPEDKKIALHETIAEYKRQLPRSYLYFGYTTLVDLNVVDRKFVEDIRAAPVHPDIFDCDGALMVANGYPMLFSPPEERFALYKNFLYDPHQSDKIPPEYKPGDHSPATIVRRVREAGGICTKLFYEDGFGPNDSWPVPTSEVMREIVEESKKYDLTTIVHANSLRSQDAAVDAGIDVIAHGMWDWNEFSDKDGLSDEIKTVLDRIAGGTSAYMPTYQTLAGLQSMYDPDFLNIPQLRHVLPVEMLSWIKSDEGRWFADSLLEDEGADAKQMYRTFEKPLHRLDEVMKYLDEAGGTFVFGTDTPANPTFGNPPGLNGYLEMRRWHEAGVSLRHIFMAATRDVARAFHLDVKYGTIEPGKTANLVIMKKNPLETVDAYDSIESIVVRGKPYQRGDFSAVR